MEHTDLRPGYHHIVIYKNPQDYPGDFVVKVWDVASESQVPDFIRIERTLEAARSHVPHGFVNLGRFADDVPAIFEVWI